MGRKRDTDLTTTIPRYLARLQGDKADRTVEIYTFDLGLFTKWASHHGKALATEITAAELEEFLMSLRRRDGVRYKATSRNQVLAAIKGYYAFLVKDRLISSLDNPADLVKAQKRPKRSPVFLEIDEASRMQQVILERQADTEFARMMKARDVAFLSLFLGTGLRISELVAVSTEDWQEATMNGWLTVIGKGDKERVVPPFDEAFEHVQAYLALRPDVPPDGKGNPLFVSRKNRRLSRVQIERLVKDWAKEAGVRKRITPHRLRATYATHLFANGANPREVQEMLGHSDLNTTMIYAGIGDKEKLRQSVRKHQIRYT